MTLRAIIGGTLIDGTGAAPIGNAVVLVEDGRIRSVSRAPEAPIPEHAEVFDASGQYVIPGLMDANAHLSFWMPDVLLEYQDRYVELIEEAAQVTLNAGVTTVFDTLGHLEPLRVVRDRISRGEVAGSRLFIAGNIIGLGGPLSPDFWPAGDVVARATAEKVNAGVEQGVGADLLRLTPEGVRRRVRDYIECSGIDFVKYASSGHGAFSRFIAFSGLAQRAIVEEAHRAGLMVQAHSTSVESLRIAIEAGVDLLQHPESTGDEPMPDETLESIVTRSLPAAVIIYTKKHYAWVQEHGSEPVRRFSINQTRMDNIQRLIAKGADVLLTTDAFGLRSERMATHPLVAFSFDCPDPPFTLGESHFLWLQAAIECGMAPMDAMKAATSDIAAAYGHAADLGTIEPSKRADLLLLDGDPLADVTNYRRIAAVMKDGAFVDRSSLPRRRLISEPDRSGL